MQNIHNPKCWAMDVLAVMSMYFVCNIEYNAKHKLMTFIEFVLTGKHVHLSKIATQLIKPLKLQ